jgi:integrase
MANILIKQNKDGRIRYQALVRVDPKHPKKKTFDTREEAETWQQATDAEERAKVDKPDYNFSLAEVLADYAIYNPEADAVGFSSRCSGLLEAKPSSIQPADLEALSDTDLDLLERAVEHGRAHMGEVLSENPVVALRARRAKLPYRPITEFEEATMTTAAIGLAGGSLCDAIILALDTGLSQQEILNLDENSVFIGDGVIRLSPIRTIPLTDRAKAVLSKRMSEYSGKLFDNLPKNTLRVSFARLRERLGLNGPDFNDLRKIAAERLAERIPLTALKDTLGYASWVSLAWLLDRQRA